MCDIFLEFYLYVYIYNDYFFYYFHYLLIIIVITINARNIPSRIDGLYIYGLLTTYWLGCASKCFHPFHLCLKHDSETTSPYGFRRWLHPNQLLLAQSSLSPSKCSDKGISQTLVGTFESQKMIRWKHLGMWAAIRFGGFGFDTYRYQFDSPAFCGLLEPNLTQYPDFASMILTYTT